MTDPRSTLLRVRTLFSEHAPELFAALAAAAWFVYLGFAPTLDPTFVSWLWRDDWSAYQWGFSFFRNAPWSWPLGSVPNLFYPHGTSVGFTDANPWACVLFKLLSPLLPRDFQFSGLWFLLCYVLQAWFGTKICRTLTRDPVQCALGGVLFAVTPLLPLRTPHIALCALFFVTAGLWLNLRPEQSPRALWHGILTSLVLLAWAAGTHAYLSVMLLVLSLAYYTRLCFVLGRLELRAWAGLMLLAFALTLAVYYLFGFVGWKETELSVEGFGLYSADLLALFNSLGISRLVPALPFQPPQWEGYAYLGLGAILLLPLLLLRCLSAPLRFVNALSRQWPLLIAVFAMFVYALSSHVTYRGALLLDLSAAYAPLGPLAGIFRSSGRFAWALHLLLVTGAIYAVVSDRQRYLSCAALLIAIALTTYEQDPHRLHFEAIPLYPLRDEAWLSAGEHYAHLELVPLHSQWDCPYNALVVDALSNEAYRRKLSFNSGNFMRKEPGTRALCGRDVATLDARTVYVAEANRVARLKTLGAVCGVLDGLYVCADGAHATPLRDALIRVPIP